MGREMERGKKVGMRLEDMFVYICSIHKDEEGREGVDSYVLF